MGRVDSYLKPVISEKLDHISKIARKANSTLGFLRRNLKECPSKLKEIVRSLLENSCPVWDPYRQGDIDKLNKTQRAAARFVTNQIKSYLFKIVFLRTIQTLVKGYSPD